MVNKYFIKQLTDNLKRPGEQINMGCVMVVTPYFNFGTKLRMRLEVASNLVQVYKTAGIVITNTMIQWDPIVKDFNQK